MKVLICGATGYGNIGDDAMRDVLVSFIHRHFPNIEITVTRPYPQESLVKNTDLVIIGGGGLLYDKNEANFDYYTKYMKYAIENKKHFTLVGIGEQGITKDESKTQLKLLLRYSSLITVRQKHDKDFFINQLGIDSNKIILGHDLAYNIIPAPIKFTGPSKKLKLMVVPGFNYKDGICDTIIKFIEKYKAKYDFYTSTTANEDLKWVEKLAKVILEEQRSVRDFMFLTPSYMAALLGEMDYVISSRFHGIVFSVNGGCKKILSIGSSQKLTEDLPIENILSYSIDIEPDYIEDRILNCKEVWPPEDALIHLKALEGLIEVLLQNAHTRKSI